MATKQRVWHAKFHGMWLNGYAVVVAPTKDEARDMVNAMRKSAGLETEGVRLELTEVPTDKPNAAHFYDGDY
jgi:hypothetical protein